MFSTDINEVLRFLPRRLAFPLSLLPRAVAASVTEVRLRLNAPLSLSLNGRNLFVDEHGKVCRIESALRADEDDLRATLAELTAYSMYAYDDTVRSGFIPIEGGARAGVCGEAVRTDGRVTGFRRIYSINIRIPRFLPDFARGLAEHYKAHGLCSALVLSPPAAGKTTFLRSIAYLLAAGNYPQPRRVGIADERCELFLPDKMGALIDCVRDMPKAAGIELLTRSMSPEVIVCDELAESESAAVAETQNSGVCLIASAHAPDYAGAMRRPYVKRLWANGIFELFVLLHAEEGYRYDLYIP